MYRRYYLAFVMTALLTAPLFAIAQGSGTGEKTKPTKAEAAKEGPAKGGESRAAATEATPAKKDAVKASGSDAATSKLATAKEGSAPVPTQPTPQVATPKPKATTAQSGAYTVRLRDLEDRINRLKEQIFRSKARLSLLAETVLDRKIAGSKATIVFRNEMGGSFRLVKATFLLDGGPIFNKSDDDGSLAERDILNLYDGPVMPGDHTLSVVLHYRGHGYGIFSYLKGYSFKTRSSRTFTVNEGNAMKLEVVGYEKGGVTTPLEDRPDIRYIMGVAEYVGDVADESGTSGDKKD